MPAVDVSCKLLSMPVANKIKDVVRRHGAVHFSTQEHQLNEADFSFIFHQPTEYDELTHDVIVRVYLHHYPERVAQKYLAGELADYIKDTLSELPQTGSWRVGVMLVLAEIGWGTDLSISQAGPR